MTRPGANGYGSSWLSQPPNVTDPFTDEQVDWKRDHHIWTPGSGGSNGGSGNVCCNLSYDALDTNFVNIYGTTVSDGDFVPLLKIRNLKVGQPYFVLAQVTVKTVWPNGQAYIKIGNTIDLYNAYPSVMGISAGENYQTTTVSGLLLPSEVENPNYQWILSWLDDPVWTEIGDIWMGIGIWKPYTGPPYPQDDINGTVLGWTPDYYYGASGTITTWLYAWEVNVPQGLLPMFARQPTQVRSGLKYSIPLQKEESKESENVDK